MLLFNLYPQINTIMDTLWKVWSSLTFEQKLLLLPFVISLLLYFLIDCPRKTWRAAFFKVLPVWSLVAFVVLDQSEFLTRKSLPGFLDLLPEKRYPLLILLGIAFSSVGDICLILADVLLIPGAVSFLVAHRFYYIAIETEGDQSSVHFTVFLVLWISVLVYLQSGTVGSIFMRIGFSLYLLALFAVGWKATAKLGEDHFDKAAVLCFVGSVLFIVSDLIIFINFLKTSIPRARFLYMGTYYVAQLAYALSTVNNIQEAVQDFAVNSES